MLLEVEAVLALFGDSEAEAFCTRDVRLIRGELVKSWKLN